MRAIEFNQEIKLHNNYPIPEPRNNEALIKVNLAGICNTDLEIVKGYMGFSGILGHEFIGQVVKVNGNRQDLINKRVVGEINCACDSCPTCLSGLKTHCPNRDVLGILNKNGCFADYVTLNTKNIIEIPDSISDEEAVFIEPLAAAIEILEQIQIKPTDKVLILGDGKLGLLISMVLNLTQAEITLVGKHKDKLKIAQDQSVHTILLEELPVKKDFDIIVEATGSVNGFELAQQLVKPRGTIVLKSTVAANKEINLAPIVIDEISIIGSRCGPFHPAIRALDKKLIDVQPLISKTFSFNQTKEAFEYSKSRGVLKVLLDLRK